jgi:hypothetical protein
MPGRGLIVAGLLVLVALTGLAAACGGGGANGASTPTVSPATEEARTATAATATVPATPGNVASPTPETSIRQEDLADQPGLRNFLAGAGGQVDTDRIIFVDLTGNGVEEAVVPVSSGGEGGDIAVFVFGYETRGLQELLRVIPENRSLSASIVDGALTVTQPVFAAGDPLCCPSQVRKTTYGWDGNHLVAADETVEPTAGN